MSSLPCGDVQKNGSGLTGALGGIPLYMNGAIAGGIGVDGCAAIPRMSRKKAMTRLSPSRVRGTVTVRHRHHGQ